MVKIDPSPGVGPAHRRTRTARPLSGGGPLAAIQSTRTLRIAMIGTRGVPAAYGGFETAVEEVGRRLVQSGNEVVVYCRQTGAEALSEYLGMNLVHRRALHLKAAETLTHTALSVAHVISHQKPDMAFVFNAANAPFLPALRAAGIPVVVHVDGLEWKRGKWGRFGRHYYQWAEKLAVRTADALIADAQGIAEYYREKFGVPTELLTYGTKLLVDSPSDRLTALGLEPGKFHLVVARFEPENHVDIIVEGYVKSAAGLPLVVVGSAPYSAAYTNGIHERIAGDPRVLALGGVWDQVLLDQLYANALTYIHGHSVGGTNPSLLRAMGAGTTTLAWDVVFNREVLGGLARCFSSSSQLSELIEGAERMPESCARTGSDLQRRAAHLYDWDAVAAGYEQLALRVATGYSLRRSKAVTARRPLVTLPVGVASRPLGTVATVPAAAKARRPGGSGGRAA